jgi:nucleoside-diphosphate-sugar epimerase
MIDMKFEKVLVTGPKSMIGLAICNAMLDANYEQIYVAGHEDVDLLNYDATRLYFNVSRPQYVVHLAGYNGNIQANSKMQAEIFYKTTQMGLNVLKCCEEFKVKKVLSIISSCAIADVGERPLREDELWNGLPNSTVECHGLAKRMLDAYSRQLYRQHKITAICAILTNSFGPNDSFNLEKTKAVASIIRKVYEAELNGDPSITFWGDGSPLREFMYCMDAGEALLQTLEKYNNPLCPINIGSGQEYSIKELVDTVVDLIGYKGDILWDTSKPNGQMRKLLDTTKMRSLLDVKITPFAEALKETVQWYSDNKGYADAKGFK